MLFGPFSPALGAKVAVFRACAGQIVASRDLLDEYLAVGAVFGTIGNSPLFKHFFVFLFFFQQTQLPQPLLLLLTRNFSMRIP